MCATTAVVAIAVAVAVAASVILDTDVAALALLVSPMRKENKKIFCYDVFFYVRAAAFFL